MSTPPTAGAGDTGAAAHVGALRHQEQAPQGAEREIVEGDGPLLHPGENLAEPAVHPRARAQPPVMVGAEVIRGLQEALGVPPATGFSSAAREEAPLTVGIAAVVNGISVATRSAWQGRHPSVANVAARATVLVIAWLAARHAALPTSVPSAFVSGGQDRTAAVATLVQRGLASCPGSERARFREGLRHLCTVDANWRHALADLAGAQDRTAARTAARQLATHPRVLEQFAMFGLMTDTDSESSEALAHVQRRRAELGPAFDDSHACEVADRLADAWVRERGPHRVADLLLAASDHPSPEGVSHERLESLLDGMLGTSGAQGHVSVGSPS